MAGRLSSRLALLGLPRFRLLFLATFASGFGNWLAVIALQVDVYDRTRSGWWVGALLVVNVLPAVFLGLLLGPVVDRVSRKALMIGSDLGRLAVFAALPFTSSALATVALAAVAGIGNAFFRPAVLAGLPNLVPDERLPGANALLQLVEWTTTAVGPIAGGAIAAASGPHLAYWANAVTFALSAALVAPIPGRLLQSDRPIGRGHWRDLAEGYAAVRRSPALMCVLVAWSTVMLASGLVNVAEVFLAKRSYGSGDLGFGLLWAGTGVGLVAGGLAAAEVIRRDLGIAYVRFLAVFAIGIGCAAAAPNVWVGMAAMALAGIGNGAAVVGNITLVQRGAADRVRGRVFTLLMSANYGVLGVAFVAAGPVTNAIGARWSYAVAAGAIALATGLAWLFARNVRAAPQPVHA
ncbi:MAG TPA: MFS transporter [Gaiellaceae bacterium]|nr:MFS transporter [Gaiellaceae bacterium]